MKTLTTTIARCLFAIPLLVFALGHLMNGEQMAAYIPLPGALVLNYVAGLGLLLAAVAIAINRMAYIACLMLALELLLFIIILHLPKMTGMADPAMYGGNVEYMKMDGMIHTFKDMAIMAASLAFAGQLKK